MADGGPSLILKAVADINTVPAADWDACAGPDNPFVSHAFLSALEDSGSAVGKTGWMPQHLLVEDECGALLACAPMYLKTHSYGEYVFDHGWAHAYEQAGGRYYPKLQVAVPFTPVPGPRLLARPGPMAELAEAALVSGMQRVAERHGVCTVHVTFLPEGQWQALGEEGWLQRTGQQFHWHNDGYRSFDDFLASLASRKRKAIRKERREVADSGATMRVLTGDEITDELWHRFYGFYIATSDRKWGYPYLTEEFFLLLGERMADKVVLVFAEVDGHPVGAALNLMGTDTLYGRNWGADGSHRFLHFEACYYQAIEFAIARGLAHVEAGAQGSHKVQRGYVPQRTYSAHLIRDPALERAVADFLDQERRMIEWEMEAVADGSPYRKGEGS